MSTSETQLDEFLEKVAAEGANKTAEVPASSSPRCSPQMPPHLIGGTVQWLVLPDGRFAGMGASVPLLESGVYRPEYDDRYGILLQRRNLKNDDIVRLPDTASDAVLQSIQTFWEQRDRFKKRGQLFKRGVLLWGPPGSGKTITIALLMDDLVERGGIVVVVDSPDLARRALELIRRVEPDRPLICVLEDIDEVIARHGEHEVLALLDGENQVDNVCHVATTNYPELLPSRLVNRPSRFDEIIKIGMPSAEARKVYLQARIFEGELTEIEMLTWIEETEGFSIAHLRELIVAVFCLGRTYDVTLQRLRAMAKKLKVNEGQMGFKN